MLSKIFLTALIVPFIAWPAAVQSQTGDALIVEMNQAFKRGDKKKLTALLPQAKGHALEGYAAYWELKARLPEASGQEVQAFYSAYPGTYVEDRLRNDWLLLLGQRRDWAAFAQEHPNYRMNDDKEVRCYALLVEQDRKSTRLNSSHLDLSRMPSSA